MSFKYMQTKISAAILALVLATTMITSTTLNNAFAQDNDTGNPIEGLVEFFENATGTGNDTKPEAGNETVVEEEAAPVEEGEVKPEVTEGTNETTEIVTAVPDTETTGEVSINTVPECPVPGNETVTPEPEVVPPVEEPVVVVIPNGTAANVTETPAENGTIPEESEIGGNETVEVPPMVVPEGNETVETPVEVVPGNETTGENGTVVLPEDVPVIVPGNETGEVIEVIENQTEAVENVTEVAENVTETVEEEPIAVTEVIQLELTKEIGDGFLTLLQVGQFIPSITAEETASLQAAAESLQTALTSAVEASGNINIEQTNIGGGTNIATVG